MKASLAGMLYAILILPVSIFFSSCTYRKTEVIPAGSNCDTTGLSYKKDIVPILTSNCYACHKSPDPPSGLALDNLSAIQSYALTPNHKLSGMIQQKPGYLPMPQNGRMSDCNINKVVAWINAGAKDN